jgi:hypothetical protein
MAYNGLANIGRLAWKMDVYGSRTSPQSRRHRRMRRMGKEATLFAKLSPESNRAFSLAALDVTR